MCFYDCICLWLSHRATMNSRQLKRTWVLKHFKRGFAFQMVCIKSRIYFFDRTTAKPTVAHLPCFKFLSLLPPEITNSNISVSWKERQGKIPYVCTYIRCSASWRLSLEAPDLKVAQRENVAGLVSGLSASPHSVQSAFPGWTRPVSPQAG